MAFEELKTHLEIMNQLGGRPSESSLDDDELAGAPVLTEQDMHTLRAQCERYKCLHTDVVIGEPGRG